MVLNMERTIEEKLIYEEMRALKRKNDIAEGLLQEIDIHQKLSEVVRDAMKFFRGKP